MNNSIINNFFKKNIQYLFLILAFFIPIHYKISFKIIVIIFMFWLFTGYYKRLIILLKNNTYIKIFTIFVLYALSSYFWSDNISLYYSTLKNLTLYLYFPFILIVTSLEKKIFYKMIPAFLLGMIFNEIVSYGIYFELWDTIRGDISNPVPFVTSHMEYSVLMGLSILLLANKLFIKTTTLKRIVYSFFTISMSINLFLSTGRTGQVSLFLTSLILVLIYFKNKIRYLIITILVIFLSFYLAYLLKGSFYSRVNTTITNVSSFFYEGNIYSSIGVRLSSYIILPELVKDNNIFYGVGIGDVNDITQKKQFLLFGKSDNFINQKGHLQNGYLTIFIALGGIGLFLLFIMLYKLFTLKIEDKNFIYIKYSSLLIIVFSNMSENMFRQKEILLLFSLFTALLIISSMQKNDNKTKLFYK